MAANPLVLIVLAVFALVAAVILAYNKVGWFRDFVNAAFSSIVAAFMWIKDAAMFVFGFISDHWQLILAILTGPFGLAFLLIKTYWGDITGFISGAMTAIVNVIKGIGSGIASAWSTIWNGLLSTASSVISTITGLVSGIWNGIGNGLKAALNGMITILNGAIGFINSKLIDNANKVPFVNIPHIPQIPALAEGGIVPATPGGRIVRVAEAGQAEAVIPLSKLDKLLNGDGRKAGDTFNIYGQDDPIGTAHAVARRQRRLAV